MKKIAYGLTVGFLVGLAAALLSSSCGADWAECANCQADESSAESVDGTEQIPIVVVVNVDVNVDVDQNQSQDQGQIQGQGQEQTNNNDNTNTNTTTTTTGSAVDSGSPPVVVHDAGSPDAGTPDSGTPTRDAGVDAGTKTDGGSPKVDAGTPPKVDAGKPDAGHCRKVCTCYEVHYVCKVSGKDTTKKSDCTCGVEKTYNKCTKEAIKCS